MERSSGVPSQLGERGSSAASVNSGLLSQLRLVLKFETVPQEARCKHRGRVDDHLRIGRLSLDREGNTENSFIGASVQDLAQKGNALKEAIEAVEWT